jgi:hypothetical protein
MTKAAIAATSLRISHPSTCGINLLNETGSITAQIRAAERDGTGFRFIGASALSICHMMLTVAAARVGDAPDLTVFSSK